MKKKILLFFSIICTLIPSFLLYKKISISLWISIVLCIFLIIINIKSIKYEVNKREALIISIFSFLFSIFQVIGYNCRKYAETNIFSLSTWFCIFLLTISLYPTFKFIFKRFDNSKFFSNKKGKLDIIFNHKYSYIIIFSLIILAWIPILINFYPTNYAYDVSSQIRMFNGDINFSKSQPVIHTLLINLFLNLGTFFFDDMNIGLLFYSIFQMIIMASIFTYIILYLNRLKVSKTFLLFILIMYMFLPTHSVFSITTTKDVIFSGLLSLTIIEFINIVLEPDNFFSDKKNTIVLGLLLFLTMAFRNNMIYAVVLSGIVFLLFLRKKSKKIMIIFCMGIGLFLIYDFMLSCFGISDAYEGEKHSVALQQIARAYNNNSLDNQSREMVEEMFSKKEETLKKYNPIVSDPIKEDFIVFSNNVKFDKKHKDFITIYFKLLKKYPKDYIDAWSDLVYGYFYIFDDLPQNDWKIYLGVGCMKTSKNKKKCIYKENIINKSYKKLLYSGNYLDYPILNILMNIALYVLLFIFTIFYIIFNKNYKYLIPLLLVICYTLTVLLGPISLLRYVYYLFTSMPLFILIAMKAAKKD